MCDACVYATLGWPLVGGFTTSEMPRREAGPNKLWIQSAKYNGCRNKLFSYVRSFRAGQVCHSLLSASHGQFRTTKNMWITLCLFRRLSNVPSMREKLMNEH